MIDQGEFTQPIEHPDVVLARQHQARRDRYAEMREREPEPDLRAAVAELAEIVALLCGSAMVRSSHPEDQRIFGDMRDRASAIGRRLS